MSIVNLVSGGLDSALVGVLTQEQKIKQLPLFVDYGQRSAKREWKACQQVHKRMGLPKPERIDVAGFGSLIRSGLTDTKLRVRADAFTPGRNFLFLLLGAAYAVNRKAVSVAIGLLDEDQALFPDQKYGFIVAAEKALQVALGKPVRVLAPLMAFTKSDVVKMARKKGIDGTYSCHSGTAKPCGRCIACLQYK